MAGRKGELPSIPPTFVDMAGFSASGGGGHPTSPGGGASARRRTQQHQQDTTAHSTVSDELTSGHMIWNDSIEVMLAKWCDESKCFEWMHVTAHSYYDKRSRIVGLFSAVLTAISGFANVAVGSTNLNGFQMAWVFGGLSILVSIIGIIQDKLAFSRLASEHRQYSIQWSIIRRKIEEELSIPPESRRECVTFLKYIRQDINQVSVEGNAQIPERIRHACYQQFKDIKDFDIPDICGDMEHTHVYVREPTAMAL